MRSFGLPANILVSGAAEVFRSARPLNLPTLLFSVLVVLGMCSVAISQTVSTRVSGVVKDTAGATVPGAKVTLIGASTKDQNTATTSDVRVGTYMVTVEATGFKKLQVSNIEAHVDIPVVLNGLVLEPGGVAETVAVT